jgi:uncharacterized protein
VALKRLIGGYAACEDEIDRVLRASSFVDLFTITRQSGWLASRVTRSRISKRSSDIRRAVEVCDARRALAYLQARLELGDWPDPAASGSDSVDSASRALDAVKRTIAEYNRDDCFSAWGSGTGLRGFGLSSSPGASRFPRGRLQTRRSPVS